MLRSKQTQADHVLGNLLDLFEIPQHNTENSAIDKKKDKKFNFLSLKSPPMFSVTNVKI